MTLLHPWSLLGLAGIPILVLLERRRRRPRPVVWPSLLLWREVAAAAPPRRRRLSSALLLECVAVALLSVAAAEPLATVGGADPRAVAVVDTGPHMYARRADGSTALEATLAELDRIDLPLERVKVQGDLERCAAEVESGIVVLATSRADVEGADFAVVGRAPDGVNLAVDAVVVRGDRLWFAVATDGEPREVTVRVGATERTVVTGEGVWTAFASPIEVLTADNYDGDDRIDLRPLELRARDDTGSRRVETALFRAGTRAVPGGDGADLVITGAGGEPRPGPILGLDCVAQPGIFDGLFLEECRWSRARARPGPGLLTWRGEALAEWLDPRTLWIGLPVNAEWDEHGTLAVVVERAKRKRVEDRLPAGQAIVGDAIAAPAPGLVWTRGLDRPWSGRLPATRGRRPSARSLRPVLALLAAAVLGLYLRAMVARRS